ncbi:MAG: tRNA pseudouridine(55) synthase TruB [Bacteroidales bacterium]|nr:tRNA pseudouridine(55) synthase TruB [Bacteroidales bacterium]MDT8432263.1 tRNA pseudouridine(55) synthase TruB [Bacteroidales bacterium]
MNDTAAQAFLEGKIILIDKDLDWTSFDVVNKLRIELRNQLGIKKIKVGHTGTLDPLATGLVILCAGKATKKIESFMGLDKEYIAEITIGATTPSYDLETGIEATLPFEHVTRKQLESVLNTFRGEIEQTPPNYSAKQVDGKRAYDMARQGESFKLKKNLVTIHELELLEFSPPEIRLQIRCSKGTYIRSLANDIGEKLGTGAYLSALRRTKIGDYHLNDAEKIADFTKNLKPL